MSDKDTIQEKEPKKRRGTFWYIAIGATILLIVYQSGRSSGVRSVTEPTEPVICRAVPPGSGNIPPVQRQDSPATPSQAGLGQAANTPPVNRPAPQNRPATGEPQSIPTPAIPPQREVSPGQPSGPPPGLIPATIRGNYYSLFQWQTRELSSSNAGK